MVREFVSPATMACKRNYLTRVKKMKMTIPEDYDYHPPEYDDPEFLKNWRWGPQFLLSVVLIALPAYALIKWRYMPAILVISVGFALIYAIRRKD